MAFVEILIRDVVEYDVEVPVNVLIKLIILLLAGLLAGISIELGRVLSWVLAVSLLARLSEEMLLTAMLAEATSIELPGPIEPLLPGSLLIESVLVVKTEPNELLGNGLVLVGPWVSPTVDISVELIVISEVEGSPFVWLLLTEARLRKVLVI